MLIQLCCQLSFKVHGLLCYLTVYACFIQISKSIVASRRSSRHLCEKNSEHSGSQRDGKWRHIWHNLHRCGQTNEWTGPTTIVTRHYQYVVYTVSQQVMNTRNIQILKSDEKILYTKTFPTRVVQTGHHVWGFNDSIKGIHEPPKKLRKTVLRSCFYLILSWVNVIHVSTGDPQSWMQSRKKQLEH